MPEPSPRESLSASERHSVARILDAASNRCREGLRVLEDYVRFHKNDRSLNAGLKQARHDFQAAWSRFPLNELLSERNTPGDVGTSVTTSQESSRQSLQDIVAANCKRVGESLRTLEEYSKPSSPELAAHFETQRYQFYTLERSLLVPQTRHERLARAHVYFLLTEQTCVRPWREVAEEAIEAGVDVIQLREKELDDRELLARARWLREKTNGTSTLFIVNDRPDIAALCEADGVHVGQEELEVDDVRRIIGRDRLVGVSTHSLPQARQAAEDRADYLGLGPTFPSKTKNFGQFPGVDFIQEASAEISLPCFAIGGIHCENVAQVVAAGGSRVAVCHVLSQAANLRLEVEKLKKILKDGNNQENNSVSGIVAKP